MGGKKVTKWNYRKEIRMNGVLDKTTDDDPGNYKVHDLTMKNETLEI